MNQKYSTTWLKAQFDRYILGGQWLHSKMFYNKMYLGKKEFMAILMPDSIDKQRTGYITLGEAGY